MRFMNGIIYSIIIMYIIFHSKQPPAHNKPSIPLSHPQSHTLSHLLTQTCLTVPGTAAD